MRCPGALLAQKQVPKRTSTYADEGTTAHFLAALTLASAHHDCEAFLGRIDPDTKMEVTQDMCEYVQEYVDEIVRLRTDGDLYVEVKVDFSRVVGVPGSFGTADAVIVKGDTLHVDDLKYGQGVAVDARDNEQLQIYALGALEMFDLGQIKYVTMGVHMPRKDGYNDWTKTVEELYEFGKEVKVAAAKAIKIYDGDDTSILVNGGSISEGEPILNPGEKQCRWCDAKAYCPALGEQMISIATDLRSDGASLPIRTIRRGRSSRGPRKGPQRRRSLPVSLNLLAK